MYNIKQLQWKNSASYLQKEIAVTPLGNFEITSLSPLYLLTFPSFLELTPQKFNSIEDARCAAKDAYVSFLEQDILEIIPEQDAIDIWVTKDKDAPKNSGPFLFSSEPHHTDTSGYFTDVSQAFENTSLILLYPGLFPSVMPGQCRHGKIIIFPNGVENEK